MVNQVITITTVNMVNTTQTNMIVNLSGKLAALIVMLISAILLALALPHTQTAFNHLTVSTAIDKINEHEELDTDKLNELIETTQANLANLDNPHYWDDLSQLKLHKWQNDFDLSEEDKQSLLVETKKTIEQSLLRSPSNASQWHRLAILKLLLNESREQIVKTLMMSVLTGPNEAAILLPRINLGLMLHSYFTNEDAETFSEQLVIAWSLSPPDFISTVANDPQMMDTVRTLLEKQHSLVLEEMEEAIEKTD